MALDLVARISLKDNLSSRMRRITGGMGDLDRRTRGVTGSIRQMSGVISAQVNSLGGLKGGLLGVAGAYLSVTGAVKAFNSTIGEAAKFEASSVAVEAIFNDKKLSDSYMKMVDKMAIDSPLLNSTDMLASSKGLVAMTKNMDDLEKSWKIVEKLQVLDPTQGTDGATFALKELFQGDNLSMTERFGLNKKELNRIKKLAIPQQIAELNTLLDGMGVTEAAINKMGSTTVGYWAQIGERADKFKRTIGEMGNSKIGAVLGDIVDKLDSIDLDAIAAKVDAGIGGAVQKVIDFTKKAWEMREPILKATKAVGIFVGTVAGIIAVVKTFGLIGAAIAFLTSPIGLLAFAIIGISKAFKIAYEKIEPFRKAINGIVGAFKAVFSVLSGNNTDSMAARMAMITAGLDNEQISKVFMFAKNLKDGFNKIKSAFKGVSEIFSGNKLGGFTTLLKAGFSLEQIGMITAFANGLRGAFDRVKLIFDGLGTMFSGGGSSDLLSALGFSQGAITKIYEFVEVVKTKVGEFVAYLASKWEAIQPGIAALLQTFTMFKDNLVNVFTTLLSLVQPIFSALMAAFKIVADIVVIAFNNVIAPVIRNVMAVIQLMWKIVGPILSLLGAAIGVAFEVLRIAWDTIIKPFVNFMTTVFKKALELAIPVIEKIGGAFDVVGGVIKQIAGWLNDFTGALKSFKVPNWLSKLGGGGTVKFEDNSGGGQTKSHYNGIDYVPYNGYQATLHKGESVVTAQENREGRAGGNISIAKLADQIVIREEADIDKFAAVFARKLIEAEGAGA